MKAIAWTGPGQLQMVDAPMPELSDGQVLVQISRVGICGSDLAILAGFHARAKPGIVLGHEFGGTVADSRSVDAPPLGTPVAVRPLIACRDRGTEQPCPACRSGNFHVCASLGLYGVDEPGGLAEYAAVHERSVYPIAANTSPEFSALAEPLAVAVHAVDRSGLNAGAAVAVFGGGPIGLLTALVARQKGAGEVVIVEPNAWRRSVAEGYGLETIAPDEHDPVRSILDRTDGAGADVVFDSAAHPSVATAVTAAARIRGTIVLVGVYKEPAAVDLRTVNFAEQTIIGTRVYTDENFAAAVALLEHDDLRLSRLPTLTYSMQDASTAFAAAAQGDRSMKVFFDPSIA